MCTASFLAEAGVRHTVKPRLPVWVHNLHWCCDCLVRHVLPLGLQT